MARIRIIVILLCLSWFAMNQANAQSLEWTNTQKGLAVAAVMLHTIDWGQTRHIASNLHKWRELNPVIGPAPSRGRVNGYFLLTGVTIGLMAHFMPRFRTTLLSVYVGGQVLNTARNFSLGLKMSF